jgi:hypothetical protein
MKYIIIKLINRIKKYMARPRVIELEQGTVSLQGFSKDVADTLTEYIKRFNSPTIINSSGTLLETALPVLSDKEDEVNLAALDTLPNRAIGLHVTSKHDIKLVTVAYNIETGQGLVEKEEKYDNIRDANTRFKMAADKYRFV